jgi:hypothetical protein
VDTHAIEVGAAAVIAAVLSGFGGAYLGARLTTRHDRRERARTRRIEAADDLVQAWATALFAIDAGINELESTGNPPAPAAILEMRLLINAAVKLSVRFDLLFVAISLASKNEDAVRDHARAAVAAVEAGDADEARRRHAAASISQAWLVNTAAEAIESTGTRRDVARQLQDVLKEPEANPEHRPPR